MATGLVDRGYRVFDRLRSRIVAACGSDKFFESYNDLIYARKQSYDWVAQGLAPFGKWAISRHFPAPPGTILVGAAGAGREALALAREGYRVVAFDPVRPLAAWLAQECNGLPIECFVGRYEDLPVVSSLSTRPATIDLRLRAPFSAAVLGAWSISHLRSDQHCIATLRQFAELTRGPILVSYHAATEGPTQRFSLNFGYWRRLTETQISALAEGAGLDVLDQVGPWLTVLRRRLTNFHAEPRAST
jgi:hypothetical protein